MDRKGRIFILSGPSGVGKKTVRELIDLDSLNMVNSVSWTTRAPREEDIEGVTYHFVTPEEFEKNRAENGFIESAGFSNKAYGTPRKALEDWIAQGKNVLLEIEVKGAAQVMEQYPEAVSIFLIPPTFDDLRKRLAKRDSGESEQDIARRIETAKTEMALKDKYKYCVVNDDANRAAAQMASIMKEEIEKD